MMLARSGRRFVNSRKGRYSDAMSSVRVMYGDGLVFIGEVMDYTFHKNIKGATKEYVVCRGANDMNL